MRSYTGSWIWKNNKVIHFNLKHRLSCWKWDHMLHLPSFLLPKPPVFLTFLHFLLQVFVYKLSCSVSPSPFLSPRVTYIQAFLHLPCPSADHTPDSEDVIMSIKTTSDWNRFCASLKHAEHLSHQIEVVWDQKVPITVTLWHNSTEYITMNKQTVQQHYT